MQLIKQPQMYQLQVNGDFSYQISQHGFVCKFTNPASQKGIAKLYTVSLDSVLLYVGITRQSMSSRLRYGLKAAGKNGYHGYKWKDISKPMNLHIWAVQQTHIESCIPEDRDIETIEAEVVYLCRRQSNKWPSHQNEIHFRPSNQCHRDAAQCIYTHAINH